MPRDRAIVVIVVNGKSGARTNVVIDVVSVVVVCGGVVGVVVGCIMTSRIIKGRGINVNTNTTNTTQSRR